ncbi:hypothetical protein BGS_0148 [Beggiatoa sp. SS]|nr:hypothetical protein BGS_0148 [Beggiatoa sp. SS]
MKQPRAKPTPSETQFSRNTIWLDLVWLLHTNTSCISTQLDHQNIQHWSWSNVKGLTIHCGIILCLGWGLTYNNTPPW